jgi:hypothetical protein
MRRAAPISAFPGWPPLGQAVIVTSFKPKK